jgi:hypothetical protein
VSMSQGQSYRFGAVLRDPVAVMLLHLAQVCPGQESKQLVRIRSRLRASRTPGAWAFLSSASDARSTITKARSAGSLGCMSRNCLRSTSTPGVYRNGGQQPKMSSPSLPIFAPSAQPHSRRAHRKRGSTV